MSISIPTLAPFCAVLLALAGCTPYDPTAAAGAAAASKAAAAATSNLHLPDPAAKTAEGRANAAEGAKESGGHGTGTPPTAPTAPTAPKAPTPPAVGGNTAVQGIAAGEPAPGGVANGTAILTPCTRDFIAMDTNGDGWIDLNEWLTGNSGKDATATKADFTAKDADANGKLDRVEFGCDAPTTGGVPTGRG